MSNSVIVEVEEASYVVGGTTSTIITHQPLAEIITLEKETSVVLENMNNTIVVAGLVGPVTTQGDMEQAVYSTRIDFITDEQLYKGEAAPGTSEAASLWRIRRVDIGVDGDVTEKWASGDANFNKIWSSRLSYSYV
jgi:hypothetical protein